MTMNFVFSPRPAPRGRVIALHCSGGGASQWSHLAEALGGRYDVAAPEHYGSESAGPWTGEHAFTLADEAARAIEIVDKSEERVHLVGHSYGGGVALKVALARPERIASMALYEPAAFYLLRQMGEHGREALAEIVEVAERIRDGVIRGDYREAVTIFVDYWNGPGAWDAMRPSLQRALIRWAPKGPLEFRALIDEAAHADAYRALKVPVLILRGEHAPMPTRIIAEDLSMLLPSSRLAVVGGAAHMGPLTHAQEVSTLIMRHIAGMQAEASLSRIWHPRTLANILSASRAEGGVS